MNILLIDEGSPGHKVQSEAIIDILAHEGISTDINYIRVYNRLPGLFRPLVRMLINIPFIWISRLFLKICYRAPVDVNIKPDLIISSGGKSAYASLIFSRIFSVKNIFVGVPEKIPYHWFSVIISPVYRDFGVPTVVSGVIPNRIKPEYVRKVGNKYWGDSYPLSPCWTILIGGETRSHIYSTEDWLGLVEGINALSNKFGIRWLITTSRRTPEWVESLLEDKLDRSNIIELVLYNREPKAVVTPFLSAADRVFVSEDSLTMASEALCSGRPVTLLAPQKLKLEKGSFFEEMILGFSQLRGVDRVDMSKLVDYSPPKADIDPQDIACLDKIATELRQTLIDVMGADALQ